MEAFHLGGYLPIDGPDCSSANEDSNKYGKGCMYVPMVQDSMPALLYLAPLLVAGIIWVLAKLLYIGNREQNLPPGPPTVPFFGNALIMPSKFIHLKSGHPCVSLWPLVNNLLSHQVHRMGSTIWRHFFCKTISITLIISLHLNKSVENRPWHICRSIGCHSCQRSLG